MAKIRKPAESKIVSFRVDTASADAVLQAAEARGLSSSDFVRGIVLKTLGPAKKCSAALAARIKALSPEGKKKLVRARDIVKELGTLRASLPAAGSLGDLFQDGDDELVAEKIRALGLELAGLKKAVEKELSLSKGLAGDKGKEIDVFSLDKPSSEDGDDDEDGENEEGGRGEKSDAEKNADGFLEIKGLVDKLRAFVEERGWLDRLFGSGDSVEDLLIKKFRGVLDGDEADGEELGDVQEKALRVIALREKIKKLEAEGADDALIQGLEDDLEPIRDGLLADLVEKKKAAGKDRSPIFWWE